MGERTYKVYCHKNIYNGYMYIGITSRTLKLRWGNGDSQYRKCVCFYEALRKYGWDSFEHLVLYEGLSKKEAETKETELIRENIAKGISYNIREDNDYLGNLRKRSVDVYDLDGNYIETCESIHDVCIKYHSGETHTYYCVTGVKKTLKRKYILAFHGDDVTKKLAEAKIDRRYKTPAHNRRKVQMLSDDGKVLKSFESATEAAEFINVKVGNLVWCCKGKRKSCGGYKWSYVS